MTRLRCMLAALPFLVLAATIARADPTDLGRAPRLDLNLSGPVMAMKIVQRSPTDAPVTRDTPTAPRFFRRRSPFALVAAVANHNAFMVAKFDLNDTAQSVIHPDNSISIMGAGQLDHERQAAVGAVWSLVELPLTLSAAAETAGENAIGIGRALATMARMTIRF